MKLSNLLFGNSTRIMQVAEHPDNTRAAFMCTSAGLRTPVDAMLDKGDKAIFEDVQKNGTEPPHIKTAKFLMRRGM